MPAKGRWRPSCWSISVWQACCTSGISAGRSTISIRRAGSATKLSSGSRNSTASSTAGRSAPSKRTSRRAVAAAGKCASTESDVVAHPLRREHEAGRACASGTELSASAIPLRGHGWCRKRNRHRIALQWERRDSYRAWREQTQAHPRGSRTTNRAPSTRPLPSRRFSAEIWPCSASTICRLIDRPSPECCPKLSPFGRSE